MSKQKLFLNVPKIYGDELLISYVKRLFIANGLPYERNVLLYNDLFQGQNVISAFRPAKAVVNVGSLLKEIDSNKTSLEVFMTYSLLPIIMMTSKKADIFHVLLALSNEEYYNYKIYRMLFNPYELKICPDCAKNEMDEMGAFLFHTSLQVPGVKVCYKHGSRLATVNFNDYLTNDLHFKKEGFIKTGNVSMNDFLYANFCHELLEEDWNVNREDLLKAIDSKVKEVIDISKLVIKEQEADGYLETLNFLNGEYRSENEFVEGMLKSLCFLYKSPEKLISINKDAKEELDINDKGIEIEECIDGVYAYTHNRCKRLVFATKEYFDYQIGCPCCGKPLNDEERVNKFYERYYKKIFKQAPVVNRNAIYFEGKSNSNPKIKLSLYQYYSLDLKKDSSKDIDDDIKYCSFNDLQKDKYEKEYISNQKNNEDNFKRRLEAMTGDEHVLMSNYVNLFHPVSIKHNYCGNIDEYTPHDFLLGKRCSHCQRKLSEEDIKRIMTYAYKPKMVFGGFVDDPNYPEDTIRLHPKDDTYFATVFTYEEPVYISLDLFLQEISRLDGSKFIKMQASPEAFHEIIYKSKEELEDEKNKKRRK